MAQNDFVPFATGTGANVLSPSSYAASTARQLGVVDGEADPKLANNAWRQPSVIAAIIGAFIAKRGLDAFDNGDIETLLTNFEGALGRYAVETGPSARAYVHTGTASGLPTALTVSDLTPAVASYSDRLLCLVTFPFAVAMGATIRLGELPALPFTRSDGSQIQGGDIPANTDALFDIRGGAARLVGLARGEVPRVGQSNTVTTLYVRPDGNDANDGSANDAANAFLTPAAAAAYGASRFSLAGGALRVKLADGNYPSLNAIPPTLGTLIIEGNLGNQAACVISGSGPAAGIPPFFTTGGTVQYRGVTLQNTGSINTTINSAGETSLTNVTLTSTVTGPGHVQAVAGGTVTFGTGCIVTSSASSLAIALGGQVAFAANVTLQNTPNFASATVQSIQGSVVLNPGVFFAGAATGPRYSISRGGKIVTYGQGQTAFPGSSPGTILTGDDYS